MTDEAMELLRECRFLLASHIETFLEDGNDVEASIIQDMIARIDALLAPPASPARGKE